VWLDCIVRRLMAASEPRGRVWIIADELPVLRRQAELETLIVRGRKRRLCAALGFQPITQLRAIYDHDQPQRWSRLRSPSSFSALAKPEPRWSSAQIGEREVLRRGVGQSIDRQNGVYHSSASPD
jgi:type IV secretory pathway TraG/TraD family ATPase VirD4